MSLIKVLIADDHALVRKSLRELLDIQVDIKVVGEVSDGVEALEQVRSLQPDVLVLDICMPRMNGLDAVQLIRTVAPDTQIVILSTHEKESYGPHALKAGARGYVRKGEPASVLLAAIRAVHRGDGFMCPGTESAISTSI